MRKVGILAIIFTALSAGSLQACIDPMAPYSAGVVLSNGESVDLDRIEEVALSESYIRTCEFVEAPRGRVILEGDRDSCDNDPVTVKGVEVSLHSLIIEVEYGGGCKNHAFELYTNKALMKSNPAQLNLWLSHDANGDNCEALVSTKLTFDVTSMGFNQDVILHVYAPGASDPFAESSLWRPVSGFKTEQCSYKFRGAYDNAEVMAHVGYFNGPFQDGSSGFRVLVIFDTSSVPSTETKSAAMVAELKRLASLGVFSPSASFIERVGAALAVAQGQYWTAQDTVLDFNMWFDGTSVNGVRGVFGEKGCGIGVAYELPDRELITASVAGAVSRQRTGKADMRAYVDKSGIHVRFPTVSGSASKLKIIDMRGREVVAVPLVKNTARFTLSGSDRSVLPLAPGCYLTSLVEAGRPIRSCIFMIASH